MIYILKKKIDYTAELVYRWLVCFNVKVQFIDSLFELYKKVINSEERVLIFDRSQLQYEHDVFKDSQLSLTLREEEDKIKQFIYYELISRKNVFIFNFVDTASNNKLIQLKLAKKSGLKIPNTKLINDFCNVDFYKKIVTKPLTKGITQKKGSSLFANYTTEIKKSDLDENTFFPSLIQEKIEKLYEVRSFYLDEKIYSMGILSQNNDKTSVDYRKYDKKNPNRYIPYKLPNEIEKKLIDLMKSLRLNCGSIDLIKDTNNEYVFLEVNPKGEFGFLSASCNYGLELVVAKKLIELYQDENKKTY